MFEKYRQEHRFAVFPTHETLRVREKAQTAALRKVDNRLQHEAWEIYPHFFYCIQMAKRKATAKQLAALARGRAVLKAKRAKGGGRRKGKAKAKKGSGVTV